MFIKLAKFKFKIKPKKAIKSLAIFLLITSWLLTVWPRLQVAHAAAAYRSSGTFTVGTGSITPPYPADMAAGDICLLAVTSENEAISLTTANGFAELALWSPQSAGTAATNPGSRLAVFWKRTVGGDSAPVVADSGNNTEGVIHCFSGILNSGNPWDTGAGGNDSAANDTSGNIPGSTTTVNDTLVVLLESTSNNATGTTNCSAWTNVNLANLTEWQDNSNTAGLGGGSCMATGEKTSAGAYGTTTVTMAATTYKGAISVALKPQPTTTLSTSSDPAAAAVAPASGIRSVGQFTYTTDTGTDTITDLTLTLAGSPAGSYAALDSVSIRATSCAGTLYFSAVAPSSDSVSFSGGTALSATTGGNTYLVCVTPKDHTLASGTYSVSPYVSGTWTSGNGNAKAGTDSNANALTIDNLAPNGATSVSGAVGNTALTLNWTTSNSSDFNATGGSVVYRWLGSSAGSEVPTEGSTPSLGSTNVNATVACLVSSNNSTSLSKIDGTGGSTGECTTTALNNGQAYAYKVFQKDNYGNYDAGVSIGTFTPSAASSSFTQNNFRFYVTANSVTLTDPWPSATLNLGEKAILTQLPAQNMTLKSGDKIRIKMNFSVSTANLSASLQAFQLEYTAAEDCTTAGGWTAVGAKASGSIWRLYDETSIGDSTAEVNNLSDSTAGAEGYYSEINPSANNPNAVNTGQYSEWDWPVEDNGAAENTTYCFRMAKSGGTAFDSYGSGSYPKITTAPGTSVIMRHGNFFQNSTEKGFFWVN